MADKKITQLTNITGANLVDADEFVVVDISADETKAITLGELQEAFDSDAGFVRFDSSGNLLVGRSSAFTTAKTEIQSDAGDPLTLALNSIDSDGNILSFYKAGTTVGSIGTNGGDVYIGTGDTGVRFVDSLDCLLPLNTSTNATRDAAIDIGYSDGGRFKDLYLSGGVVFGDAGGSGTSSSNTLDSYEEGTWTPTAEAGLDSISVSSATYTKIGRIVFIHFTGTLNGDATSSQVRIGGLPFTPQSSNSGRGDATPWIDFCALGADDYIPKAAIYGSETYIRHFRVRTNSKVNQGNIEGNMLDSASEYNINISYTLA